MTDPLSVAGLLQELPGASLVSGSADSVVTTLEDNSRRVTPGALFVAVPGFVVDGHSYLQSAISAGASALLVQRDHGDAFSNLPPGPAVVAVDDTRAAMAQAAAWFYGHPGRELVVIGVTGTDGKTTTSHMLTSVLEAAGAPVGRLGTVDVYLPGETGSLGRMTTPEAPEVQRLLRRMVDAGCDFAIVESTSHGLALHRLDQVEYDIAVFTNITGDHLDFHKTFEAYREAKGRLFEALDTSVEKGPQKVAVVNADDPSANAMLSRTKKAAPLRYGLESREADLLGRNLRLRADGTDFRLITPGAMADTSIQLPAVFNVSNALAAAGAGLAAGVDLNTIARGLSECRGVAGRMERIDAGQPFTVIVDYAHTGDAVRKVLEVLREVCGGRLMIVVGAAGERDPGRRFGVGRAAAAGADFAIFTSEDPRSEDPASHRPGDWSPRRGRRTCARHGLPRESKTAVKPSPKRSAAPARTTCSSSPARVTKSRWSMGPNHGRGTTATWPARNWRSWDSPAANRLFPTPHWPLRASFVYWKFERQQAVGPPTTRFTHLAKPKRRQQQHLRQEPTRKRSYTTGGTAPKEIYKPGFPMNLLGNLKFFSIVGIVIAAIMVGTALLTTTRNNNSSVDLPTATPTSSVTVDPSASPSTTPTADPKVFTKAEQVIDATKNTYTATIKTNMGDIVLALNADAAPNTVNSFVFLAQKGYFDNTIIHRVVQNFVIQMGDPKGDGTGGPGYSTNDEPNQVKNTRGTVVDGEDPGRLQLRQPVLHQPQGQPRARLHEFQRQVLPLRDRHERHGCRRRHLEGRRRLIRQARDTG